MSSNSEFQENSFDEDFTFENSKGWVAIPRKLQDELFYTDSNYVHLFIHIILNINKKDGIYRGVVVKRFQMLTGRKSLSLATGIEESKIERILAKLEELNYIKQQKTNKYRLITILHRDTIEIFKQQQTTGQQQKTQTTGKQERQYKENNIKEKNQNEKKGRTIW